MKFFFLLVCVAASTGACKECDCSSASSIPSQLRQRREVTSASLKSKLSLLSESRSGKLCKDFIGDVVFDALPTDSWSQLRENTGEAVSRDDWRRLRGLWTK